MIAIPEHAALTLVHTPIGRDAEIASALLKEAGISARIADSLQDLVGSLGDNVAFVVITEEAMRGADLRLFSAWIEQQPSWSDLPFIVLTARGGGPERNPGAALLSEILGNVSFVERPFHATTFISVTRSALRGRRRQWEARSRIEALDEKERRLQTALEAGRLGAWELDLATNVLTTSSTCRGIFGRAEDEDFSYEDLLQAIHPDDLDEMKEAVRTTIETGADYSIAYRTIWPDASIHGAEIRAQLHRDRAGRPIKLVGVSADVTQRLQAEQEQRHQNELLEERVSERTRELKKAHDLVLAEVSQRERAEEQLRQAQKMEAIGQLTGGVAHDFNNLLMAVLANLELLRKHVAGDERASRLVEGAMQGARRGASLTQRLLAFARRQDLQVGPVNLSGLVTTMEELLQRSVGSRIAIQVEVADGLPQVSADANQLELALLNLAVNARDAMPDGGAIHITLREAEVATDSASMVSGSYVVLSVRDEGIGMDEGTLQKAIEPFFSTKELGKGTGLGLSMVHGLALQLGGQLALASTPGKGTTAEIWIPVSANSVVAQPLAETVPDKPSETGPKRILLVDDDVLIAMSSADMLSDLGHEVVEVYSGKDALALIDTGECFDLVITDYSMPGMTGAELAKALHERLPYLPIILASGYADLPPGVEMQAARLSKPYTQEQLAHTLSKIF
ncbi:two-component system sensor histidine kinase/response regulator [Rhizobium sp. Root149]|uniref:hybrid sensor histidine kinase/response regulator n=1 Tax=Rhizobium TaxID=379 RepID=UPI0007151CB3|nr:MULTISPECIES: hybrid sensor histidine kinase/response regulator [Rhizobium]KQZ56731.1 two-component system sensor histidine kinase/response regulator [Rhizobium sp. Root149]